MATKFAVIFDNGGGTTLQVGKRGFVHNYDYADQAARDVKVLIDDGNTNGWDGNQPECRMEYDADMERNGGYHWHNQDDVRRIVKAGKLGVGEQFGHNMREFYKSLGVDVEE